MLISLKSFCDILKLISADFFVKYSMEGVITFYRDYYK